MSSVFIFAAIKKDNSFADIAWGPGFIAVTLIAFLYNKIHEPRHFLITGLIFLWGTRLALHIFLRHRGKTEDERYRAMRAQWNNHILLNSFLRVFMAQGLILLVIASPLILINNTNHYPLNFFDLLSVMLWTIGFFFEAVGDWQLTQFLKKSSNKGHILTTGVWRYTRHPNYFGEITMWWGIFLIVLHLPMGFFTVISPLTITYLLLFVSGIPLLEKPFENNPEFQEYKQTTNALIPWFPKR